MPTPCRRALVITSHAILVLLGVAGVSGAPETSKTATFDVTHRLTVKDVPAGAKSVRVWFWTPDDDEAQKVLDLEVAKAPQTYRITRDAANGHRYLYAEVQQPGNQPIILETHFKIKRSVVHVDLDPAKAGVLTDVHRTVFAEYLRRDCPYMEVDSTIAKLADEVCGMETNVVKQARALFDYVVANTNHYSKPGAPKSSGKGSVSYCLDSKGGGCTDQHALFIAMARARGIPTRLHFGSRLTPQNENKEYDPGYRCWVSYFVPNYGWVPMDASAANTIPADRDWYFSGLDERRIHFLDGRDLELTPRQDGPRVNLMIAAYVEVDGKPHANFERIVRYTVMPEQPR